MEKYVGIISKSCIWGVDILIFVTLGTNDKSFKRLLKEIDKQIVLGNIKEKVIVQSGYTKYKSNNMKIIDLMSMSEFNKNIEKCNLLITHGGVGTILDGLKLEKKIIAFPRLSKYSEHVNDHQVEIIDEFSKEGYILTGKISNLNDIIKSSRDFVPKKYKSNNSHFNKMIINFIDNI